jgi:uncharacterized membrane protein
VGKRPIIIIPLAVIAIVCGIGWPLAAARGSTFDAVIGVKGRIESDDSAITSKTSAALEVETVVAASNVESV